MSIVLLAPERRAEMAALLPAYCCALALLATYDEELHRALRLGANDEILPELDMKSPGLRLQPCRFRGGGLQLGEALLLPLDADWRLRGSAALLKILAPLARQLDQILTPAPADLDELMGRIAAQFPESQRQRFIFELRDTLARFSYAPLPAA